MQVPTLTRATELTELSKIALGHLKWKDGRTKTTKYCSFAEIVTEIDFMLLQLINGPSGDK